MYLGRLKIAPNANPNIAIAAIDKTPESQRAGESLSGSQCLGKTLNKNSPPTSRT
jgi:hypothetical protein